MKSGEPPSNPPEGGEEREKGKVKSEKFAAAISNV